MYSVGAAIENSQHYSSAERGLLLLWLCSKIHFTKSYKISQFMYLWKGGGMNPCLVEFRYSKYINIIYIVSPTAETLEINRQRLLLLIFFKQQVAFVMEQTGWARTLVWAENIHLYPSTLMRCHQRITPRTLYLNITPVTFNDITSDKLGLNLAPLSHC